MRHRKFFALTTALTWPSTWACHSTLEVAGLHDQSNEAVGPDSALGSFDAAGPEPDTGECEPEPCRGRPASCGNCLDDDLDGLSDLDDPDCWGLCDDSEVTWGHSMPCSNESCYFDRDCGFGNDDACTPLIPNGCDCHGCCQVRARETPILLGTLDAMGAPTCAASVVTDPSACASCELDPACVNPCDEGEVCFGPL